MELTNLKLDEAAASTYRMEDGSSVHFVVAGTGYFDIFIAPPKLKDVPVYKLLEHRRVGHIASEKLEPVGFPGGSWALACSEVNGIEWITIRMKYTEEEKENYGRVFERMAKAKEAKYLCESEAEEYGNEDEEDTDTIIFNGPVTVHIHEDNEYLRQAIMQLDEMGCKVTYTDEEDDGTPMKIDVDKDV